MHLFLVSFLASNQHVQNFNRNHLNDYLQVFLADFNLLSAPPGKGNQGVSHDFYQPLLRFTGLVWTCLDYQRHLILSLFVILLLNLGLA